MLTRHTSYRYDIPYNGPFVITQCFTNGTVNLKCGALKNRYNICRIKPYKPDTKVEYSNSINMYDAVNIWINSYILLSYFKAWKKCMIGCTWQQLTLIHIVCVHEGFMMKCFLHNECNFNRKGHARKGVLPIITLGTLKWLK